MGFYASGSVTKLDVGPSEIACTPSATFVPPCYLLGIQAAGISLSPATKEKVLRFFFPVSFKLNNPEKFVRMVNVRFCGSRIICYSYSYSSLVLKLCICSYLLYDPLYRSLEVT
jgi:hypothetical protein